MRQRWISAAVAIPVFLGLVLWGAIPFAVTVFLLAAMGMWELVRAYRNAGLSLNVPLAVAGIVLPAWSWADTLRSSSRFEIGIFDALANPVIVAVLWALGSMTWEVIVAARTGDMHAGRNVGHGLLCASYIGLFSGMAWLRATDVSAHTDPPTLTRSPAPLLITLLCVWTTDSFAYFVGRKFGKRKLAPLLSPGKTVEGAVGGLAFSLFFGGLFGWLFFHNVGLGLAVGAIAGIFGQVGDLFESALKRELGIKDFGGILPGHGGVLDRFDSLLFVAPLSALLFHLWNP